MSVKAFISLAISGAMTLLARNLLLIVVSLIVILLLILLLLKHLIFTEPAVQVLVSTATCATFSRFGAATSSLLSTAAHSITPAACCVARVHL